MLAERTGLADVKLDFKFKGGATYSTIMSVNNPNNDTCVINSLKINEALGTKTATKVGNVSKRILTLELVSKDMELISTNKASKYYGLMDSSSVIYVYVRAVGDDRDWSECAFGKYFVTSWKPKSSTEDNKTVNIEATCRMASLVKSAIPTLQLRKGYTLEWYVNNVCRVISDSSESDDLKFGSDIQLGEFNDDSELCLKLSTVNDLLNETSLGCLKYIFFDRTGNIVSKDILPNRQNMEPIVRITDSQSVISGYLDTGNNLYSKLNVSYVKTHVTEQVDLARLDGYKLTKSTDDTSYSEVKMPNLKNTVYKVLGVQLRYLNEDVADVEVRDIQCDGNSLTLKLLNWSNSVTECDIVVTGQFIEETELMSSFLIGAGGESELNVTNKILSPSLISSWGYGLVDLLKSSNYSLEVTGNFNVKIKPGDIVEAELETLDVHGLFLVTSCSWTFDGGVNCVMGLDLIEEITDDNIEVVSVDTIDREGA